MLELNNSALVVIDVQGRLATLMYEKEKFYKGVTDMIHGAQALGLPIVWNEQLPDKLGATIPEVASLLEGAKPLAKQTFSCCGNDDFVRHLRKMNRSEILLTGMETHICVYQTARDLLARDYEVYVVADAISSRSKENREIGVKAMMQLGAKITSVEMALFELMRVAEGETFRRLIQIVK